jgi:NAD(P)-dependent dehydrogenase (short-subunit alcohol dehydrogenase family)
MYSRRCLEGGVEVTSAAEQGRGQQRVAVVTGGGGGIGSNAALMLSQSGAIVIALDSGVGVFGERLDEPTAELTAKRIEAHGGTARSSMASVTDLRALKSLFDDVVEEFGSLDIVVNAAGILRAQDLPLESEDDWRTVIEVHLDGYLNVLTAALPIMTKAGYGRIIGFPSGVGLARTSVHGVSYGSAKRAVAAVTWQLADLLPDGVCVNAMSPIAATRMITHALTDNLEHPKGLDLSAMPQPEHMAPALTYLSSEEFGWCSGEVFFSAGPEFSVIGRPKLIEAVRSENVGDFKTALGTLFPVVFTPGEAQQSTTGGSNPRFGPVFDAPTLSLEPTTASESADRRSCIVVANASAQASAIADAISQWGLSPVGIGSWQPFDASAAKLPNDFIMASETLARAVKSTRGVDAIVVMLDAHDGSSTEDPPSWQQVLASHSDVTKQIVAHGAWLTAAFEQAIASGQPLRLVFVCNSTAPGGHTIAQGVAQMARSANDTPSSSPFDVFSLAIETTSSDDIEPVAQLVARLASADDGLPLAGAELAAGPGWIGLRAHPAPSATLSFGLGPVPAWVNSTLRQIISDRSTRKLFDLGEVL